MRRYEVIRVWKGAGLRMASLDPKRDRPFHIYGFRGLATNARGYSWQKLLCEHIRRRKNRRNLL